MNINSKSTRKRISIGKENDIVYLALYAPKFSHFLQLGPGSMSLKSIE